MIVRIWKRENAKWAERELSNRGFGFWVLALPEREGEVSSSAEITEIFVIGPDLYNALSFSL